jgi:RND family efflux transporter MFP subunit
VKTRRVGVIVSGLVLLAVVVGLAALRVVRARAIASEPTLAAAPVVVEEATVRRGTLRETRRFLGELMAAEQPPLAARIMAQVVDVGVREGDRVAAGTPLIELDPRELDDGVTMAEAAVAAAREGQAASQVALAAERDSTARDKVLVDAGAISREAWDRSSARLAAAQARYEAARAQLTAAERALASARTRRGYATIVAPFDGVVAARLVDRGDLAVPGKPLLALLPASGIRVRVKVPVETLMLLKPGTAVTCLPEGAKFEARIARVFPAADSARLGTFEASVPADAPRLVAGTTMAVELGVDSPEALIVPRGAILEGAQGAFVFVIDRGGVHQVSSRVVARTATEVAIDAPIDEGSTVVVAQASRLMLLAEGTMVQPAGSLATR